MKKRIKSIVSILLCFFITISTFTAWAAGATKPNSVGGKATVWFAFVNFREKPSLTSDIKEVFLIGKTLDVLGYEEDFIKVKDPKTGEKGYVFKILLIDSGDTTLTVTTYNNVYKGDTKLDSLTIEYNGSKDITWSLSKSGVVEVTKGSKSNMLTVKGISPESVVLTVRAGLLTATCDLHCYYLWNKEWTAKAKVTTTIWKGPGSQYGEKATLSKNARFTVSGDDGGSAGWAYGYTTKNNKNYWGYVKINDISTKGTVSQYNNMKTTIIEYGIEKKVPWYWPILNEIDGVSKSGKANYISSPYAPRSDTTSTTIHHRGMDITTGTTGEIKKYSVVSAVSGTVKAIRPNIDSCGFCISISSDCLDLVTGQKIAVIYMHLYEAPKHSNGKLIQPGDEISAGDIIGKVGNSNNNTSSQMGYHLHFETNNRNAAVGDSGRNDFTNTINPIYYYLDKSIRINTGSEACRNGYTAYWYNNDK